MLPHLPELSLRSLLAFKSSGPYPGLLSTQLGTTQRLPWPSEGLLCAVDFLHAEWGPRGHTEAPAHALRGLLEPLAQVIEHTKMELPNKKCETCPWIQKNNQKSWEGGRAGEMGIQGGGE